MLQFESILLDPIDQLPFVFEYLNKILKICYRLNLLWPFVNFNNLKMIEIKLSKELKLTIFQTYFWEMNAVGNLGNKETLNFLYHS